MALTGIWGNPWIDLAPWVDADAVAALDTEICIALTQVDSRYTGGSHRSLDIVPPNSPDPVLPDYGEVIREMSDPDFALFASLNPDHFVDARRRKSLTFGEEGDVPLSRAQMLYLELHYGVYFPWKVYYELMPGGRRWEDQRDPEGKHFTDEALAFFPRTIRFIRSLPFEAIGSVKLLGLTHGDHGTIHRDGDPDEQDAPDPFITFCPANNKRLFLWDEATNERTHLASHAYWFNDHDWHGVAADPGFRYSIRVDGPLEPDFLAALEAAHV